MPRPLNILVVLLGLAGGWIWLRGAGNWLGPDGLAVLSLSSAPLSWRGGVDLAGWGAAAAVMSLGTAWVAGARRGMLVMAVAGWVVAMRGGPIDGLLRYEAGRGLYLRMMAEVVVLQGVGVLWLMVLRACEPESLAGGRGRSAGQVGMATGVAAGVLGGLIAAVVGQVLIQQSAAAQVSVSLLVGFVAAGVLVHAAFGRAGARGVMILGPLLLGLGAYGVMAWRYGDGRELMRAWYEGRLSGLGMMLPVQIVAAGWLGSLLGEQIGRRMGGDGA